MSTGELPAVESRVRLFVAVEVPASVREGVDAACAPLHRKAPDARWIDPTRWHLTLAFVGWTGFDQISEVEAACGAAAEAVGPFSLALNGKAGTFGRRVLWVGLGTSEDLAALAEAVGRELRAAGFPIEERPFRAHLTLARAGRGEPLPRGLAESYAGPTDTWRVERFVLMRSKLRRSGPKYTIEAAWRL